MAYVFVGPNVSSHVHDGCLALRRASVTPLTAQQADLEPAGGLEASSLLSLGPASFSPARVPSSCGECDVLHSTPPMVQVLVKHVQNAWDDNTEV
jgi:hypothetical protein